MIRHEECFISHQVMQCLICFVVLWVFFPSSFNKPTNIFQVPEVPKKAVPEKKVPVPVPKKLKPPPAKGTCQRGYICLKKNHSLFFLKIS